MFFGYLGDAAAAPPVAGLAAVPAPADVRGEVFQLKFLCLGLQSACVTFGQEMDLVAKQLEMLMGTKRVQVLRGLVFGVVVCDWCG